MNKKPISLPEIKATLQKARSVYKDSLFDEPVLNNMAAVLDVMNYHIKQLEIACIVMALQHTDDLDDAIAALYLQMGDAQPDDANYAAFRAASGHLVAVKALVTNARKENL